MPCDFEVTLYSPKATKFNNLCIPCSQIFLCNVLKYVLYFFFIIHRNQGITVLSIAVGDKVNYTEINCIASSPALVVNTTDFTTLPQVQQYLVSVACDIPVGKIMQLPC